eukprot:GFUD01033081.1.p1 GENE.GFUD01033081.1~~GFUD01033081.1.p1  ORF type:complete len:122 (-),score=5.29 GFUD01033081.1:158-523(-)
MGENTMLVDGVECEIMSTREKESLFKMSVPILHPFWAALFGFLNLVPGLGTFLGALTLMCFGRSSYETNLEGMLVGIGTAFLQAATSILIIGWFWSIMHGMYFIRKSQKARAEKEEAKSKA